MRSNIKMDQLEDPKKIKPHHIAIGFGTVGGGIWTFMDPKDVMVLLGNAWEHEFTKMTLAFTLAAWIHRGWMRKDFNKLVDAVNNLGTALGGRVGKVEDDVSNLKNRMTILEQK